MLWGHPWALHRFHKLESPHVTVDWNCLLPSQRCCEVGMVREGGWQLGDKIQGESSLSFPTCHPELFPCPWGSWVQLCVVHWVRYAHYNLGRKKKHGLKLQLECREDFVLWSFSSLCVCPHRSEVLLNSFLYQVPFSLLRLGDFALLCCGFIFSEISLSWLRS